MNLFNKLCEDLIKSVLIDKCPRAQVIMEMGGDLEGYVFDVALRPLAPGEMERNADPGTHAVLKNIETGNVRKLRPPTEPPPSVL